MPSRIYLLMYVGERGRGANAQTSRPEEKRGFGSDRIRAERSGATRHDTHQVFVVLSLVRVRDEARLRAEAEEDVHHRERGVQRVLMASFLKSEKREARPKPSRHQHHEVHTQAASRLHEHPMPSGFLVCGYRVITTHDGRRRACVR